MFTNMFRSKSTYLRCLRWLRAAGSLARFRKSLTNVGV
jgi:hypothetical protein